MAKLQKDDANPDQYIDPKDFHTLLSESVRQERSDRLYKFSSLLLTALTPLTIGAGTWILTLQQINSAREIAESNIQSAQTIANANREQSRRIADSDQKIQQLKHINAVFQDIISPKNDLNDSKVIESLKMEIASLETYGDYSLRFLVNISKHFERNSGESRSLDDFAMASVRNILSKNQLDLTGQIFSENNGKDELNLRKKVFSTFDLSKGSFINVNLFRANFTQSTLRNSNFERSDLYETIFTGCNLKYTTFTKCNLQKSNFEQAMLEDVRFIDCKLKGAKFTLYSLLKVDKLPFNMLIAEKEIGKISGKDKYLNLLLPHVEEIKKMGSESDKLKRVAKALDMEFQTFIEKLTTLKEQSTYSHGTQQTFKTTNKNKLAMQ